ncbi:uncharacterized protein F4807DRAFT_426756 [Annulohypoxylon truncatum]|uniref:uncharacterized protein n=1 Tax=Annulohypoxylon truncatum TaxID=327061 RepID=UPI002007E967|nr:uncharacterized protein F4807DRAFT_426756 [Annulohypoxylon truncatum]KAI1209461.1 hypothetical protein F4807DRAFT_426756 [Annulohypoxylon truncatum]
MPSKWVVNGYYSPAICPYGYTNACFMTQSNVETTICCPTNLDFSCYPGVAYNKFGCSYSTSTMALTSLLIDYGQTTTGTYTDVTITTQPIWAFSVQVQKAASITSAPTLTSSDVSILSDPTATSNPASSTTLDAPSVVQTALTSTSSVPPTNKLAGSAIAGIVVGILGALALGVVGTFLLMRRKKTQNISPPHPNASHCPPGQQQSINEPERVIYELSAKEKSIHELDEQSRPSEMPSWARRDSRRSNKQMAWELPA